MLVKVKYVKLTKFVEIFLSINVVNSIGIQTLNFTCLTQKYFLMQFKFKKRTLYAKKLHFWLLTLKAVGKLKMC